MSGDNHKNEALLVVQDLRKYFPIRGGLLQRTVAQVKAVDGVSFVVRKGETLGLVGESGCGKTTVGRTILRLTPATAGTVTFEGQDVFKLKGNQLKALRRDMQIIFQDPYSSLDPRMPIGESVGEGLLVHGMRDAKKRNEIVIEMLRKVGLEDYHARRYPHEFSGGQRQRIGIARALALRHPVAGAQHPQRPAGRVRADLPLHRAQLKRGGAHQRPGGRDVPGQAGRADRPRDALSRAAPSLHQSPALGHPDPRSNRQARADHPARRRALAGEPAAGLSKS
jgi:ABC-type ATPase involved in cell division